MTAGRWRVALKAVAAIAMGGVAFFVTIPAFCSGSCTAIVGFRIPADSSTFLIYVVGVAIGVLVGVLVWWLLGLTRLGGAKQPGDRA